MSSEFLDSVTLASLARPRGRLGAQGKTGHNRPSYRRSRGSIYASRPLVRDELGGKAPTRHTLK
jgi:hypothetical protein